MKDTLGHQSEEEIILDDALAAESRVRALDSVLQKLSIEIASVERVEKHTLSDEEIENGLRNIGSYSHRMQPGRSVEDMKKEYFNLLKERQDLALKSLVGKMRSDFAAIANPRPTVPANPQPTVSVGNKKDINELTFEEQVRKYLSWSW